MPLNDRAYLATLDQYERTMHALAVETKAELRQLWEHIHAHNAELRVQDLLIKRLDHDVEPILQGPEAVRVRFQYLTTSMTGLMQAFEEIRTRLEHTLKETREACAEEIAQLRREREQSEELVTRLDIAKLGKKDHVTVALITAISSFVGMVGLILREWLKR
jgi:hypothetical protein